MEYPVFGAEGRASWLLSGALKATFAYRPISTATELKDIAIWRPSNGVWYILGSRDGKVSYIQWGITTPFPTGGIEDVPVPADYDGDKIDDIAVWRPVDGRWYVLTSKSGFSKSVSTEWGIYGDIPVPADYDGDGRADAAIFRSMQPRWYIAESKTGNLGTFNFGLAGDDLLVPAEYTGDGRADVAVYRTGVWYVFDLVTCEMEQFEFGFADAEPVPADYDGDGTTDFAFYRQGAWYIHDGGKPRVRSIKFGRDGDIPLNSLSVKPSIIAVR